MTDTGVGRRPVVVYADGPGGPLPDPRGVSAVAALAAAGPVDLVLGWLVRAPSWLGDLDPARWRVTTLLAGAGTRAAVAEGTVRSIPTRLSAVPGLLAGRLRPDVAVVGAHAEGGRWRCTTAVGWAPAAAREARRVVIERWPVPPAGLPPTPPLSGDVVEVIERVEPPDPAQVVQVGEREAAIAGHVVRLVPSGAVIQWGPGALGAALVGALDRPVGVASGLVTDELVGLAERGLLEGTAEAAYAWGGEGLDELLQRGRVRLLPVEHTHDARRLGGLARFTAVNTALQVGLDGAANVEVAGGRVVSGPGGHPDFCQAAARSPGGLSIISVRSRGGSGPVVRPGIVEHPEVVSTPHCDVDAVVTEYGVADLRGLDRGQRAAAIAAVAHPEDRGRLGR